VKPPYFYILYIMYFTPTIIIPESRGYAYVKIGKNKRNGILGLDKKQRPSKLLNSTQVVGGGANLHIPQQQPILKRMIIILYEYSCSYSILFIIWAIVSALLPPPDLNIFELEFSFIFALKIFMINLMWVYYYLFFKLFSVAILHSINIMIIIKFNFSI